MTRQNPHWTNISVMGLAKDEDPIRVIEGKARETVLAAAQEGWEGPPFDPFKLAELLKIHVVPSVDVLDARTVPLGQTGFQIEFNPNRSPGRIRFSVAHEITHTFFPDCSETVRNRALSGKWGDDEWQLELLCNIGAAAILMPTEIGDLEHEPVNIENLLRLRREYDVSTEALFLRVIKLTEQPCAMFSAARPRGSEERPVYRLDYSIPSRTWAS